MLSNLKAVLGATLNAIDGDSGRVTDIYFDDRSWMVRHIVAKTGGWLSGRYVLLDPQRMGCFDERKRRLPVSLTRHQIERSPHFDSQMPVSRQHEAEMSCNRYFWSSYAPHEAAYAWNFGAVGVMSMEEDAPRGTTWDSEEDIIPACSPHSYHGDPHLRSACEVVHYDLDCLDGLSGNLRDLLLDLRTGTIPGLAVNTGNWLHRRTVLVPTTVVRTISWETETVGVNWVRSQIQEAPVFDPASPLDWPPAQAGDSRLMRSRYHAAVRHLKKEVAL